jgi:hypothetical protein
MKKTCKKLLTYAEIPSFQKFLLYCPTAKMAEFMFPNVAYRATVYKTGGKCTRLFLKFDFEIDSVWHLFYYVSHSVHAKAVVIKLDNRLLPSYDEKKGKCTRHFLNFDFEFNVLFGTCFYYVPH